MGSGAEGDSKAGGRVGDETSGKEAAAAELSLSPARDGWGARRAGAGLEQPHSPVGRRAPL